MIANETNLQDQVTLKLTNIGKIDTLMVSYMAILLLGDSCIIRKNILLISCRMFR